MNNNKMHLLFIVVVIVLVYFYVIPREYDFDISAIRYNDSNLQTKEIVNIKFDGVYKRRVFKDDNYYGNIHVDGKILTEYTLNFDEQNRSQIITYDEGSGQYLTVGAIYTNENFSEFVIYLGVNNVTEVIVGPSNNFDEAEVIVNTLLKNE